MNSQENVAPKEELLQIAATMLAFAAISSLVISQLTLLILGAQIIAGERSLRTAEFLFYLPPSRKKVLSGKLLFCAIFAGLIWVTGLTIFVVSMQFAGDMQENSGNMWKTLMAVSTVGFALFGMAWLGSSFLPSPTFSVGLSVVAIVAIYMVVIMSRAYLNIPPANLDLVEVFSGIYLFTGLAGIIGGWLYFLRRSEP